MKVLFIVLALSLIACDDGYQNYEIYKPEQLGCQYTNQLGKTPREFVRCCTYKEFQAGSNVSKGGVTTFNSSHTWIAAESCDQCQ